MANFIGLSIDAWGVFVNVIGGIGTVTAVLWAVFEHQGWRVEKRADLGAALRREAGWLVCHPKALEPVLFFDARPAMDASLKMALDRQGYRLIGDGGAVKVCHWCKESLKTGRGCYKQKFYGIDSHRCIQMTPNVHQCNEMCLFCWRYQGYQLSNENPVEPVQLIEGAIEAHRKLIVGWKGDPRVSKEKFEEAWNPNQVAISLSGEPTMYKYLADLLAECHKRQIRTFLVTNGTGPAVLERLDPLPYQLYVTVAGPNEDVFNRLCAPQTPRLWENLNKTLELLPSLSCRTVIRHTLVKGWNLEFVDEFARMDAVGDPDFIEPKGYVWVGDSRNRLAPENMPSFNEILDFGSRLAHQNGLEVLDSDPTSRVCLVGGRETNRWVEGSHSMPVDAK